MAARSSSTSIARSLLAVKLSGSQVVQAAAGHGRSSNSGGSSGGGGGGGANNSSPSSNGGGNGSGGAMIGGGCGNGTILGSGGSGGGGALGGGAGAGGMPPGGNGGRGNYGPSSPPTGSLPPFYESLKGGNNLANFANQYNSSQGKLIISISASYLRFFHFTHFLRVRKTWMIFSRLLTRYLAAMKSF